jgi:hypothetical protein
MNDTLPFFKHHMNAYSLIEGEASNGIHEVKLKLNNSWVSSANQVSIGLTDKEHEVMFCIESRNHGQS